MTGVLVLPGGAPETEWHAARRRGVTASEIATVMGLAPQTQNSPFALYHRKRGELPEPEDNDEMTRGRYLEPYAVSRFIELRPSLSVTGDGRALYAHPHRPWQLATPDRLVTDPLVPLEIKTALSYDGWGDDGTDEIPVHYRCQLLWQMDVLGAPAGILACLFVHTWKIRLYELALGEAELADLTVMRAEARAFLSRIERGNPPPVDWAPATRHALKQLHPGIEDRDVTIPAGLARQYRAAAAAVHKAENRKRLAENRIRDRLGDGRRVYGPTGQLVAIRLRYDTKRVDVKTLRARYPQVAAACQTVSATDKLMPAKTAEDPT